MRTKHLVNTSLTLLLLTTASAVHAQAFVGASFGRADWKGDFCSDPLCDLSQTAKTVRAGYRISPYWGVQARYFDLGTARTTSIVVFNGTPSPLDPGARGSIERSGRGGGVGAFVSWPMSERFSLSGLAGIARVKSKTTGTGFFAGTDSSTTDTQAYYGVGLSYAITPALAASLEAERYRVPLSSSDKLSVDVVAAGISYRF